MIEFYVNRNLPVPLIRQVYEHIRNQIIRGTLQPDDKIPSSREMAQKLNVSRNVVLEAYQLLVMERYVISKPHSGTYVAKVTGFTHENQKNPKFLQKPKTKILIFNKFHLLLKFSNCLPQMLMKKKIRTN